MLPAGPGDRRRFDHVGRGTFVAAAEAVIDEHEIQIERPVILPPVFEIPDRLLPRLRIGGIERGVRRTLAFPPPGSSSPSVRLH